MLFFVLPLVLGQERTFSWDGPGEQTLAPDPINRKSLQVSLKIEYEIHQNVKLDIMFFIALSLACLTDENSCGCCLMQKKKWELEQYINSSMNSLEDLLAKAQNTLKNIRGKHTHTHKHTYIFTSSSKEK